MIALMRAICNLEAIKTTCGVFGIDETHLPSGSVEFNAVILMDLECNATWHLLAGVNLRQHDNFEWLLLNAERQEMELLEVLERQNLGPSSEVTYVMKHGEEIHLKQGAWFLGNNVRT